MEEKRKRYIGLDVHKHYRVARTASGTVPSGVVDEKDPDEAG